ncbi:MAG: helix-turn-helix transcriptional regulator [Verrucomicrobiales bacterium]|nr:helix-turn-helix transcriptional regulator [Verrucomicrobiales bacterium]
MLRSDHARRSNCPIGLALDLVGDRWTLLIVRDLMFRGFREFGEFLRAGEGISTNILTDRLRRLTSVGLVVQSDHPTDRKKFVYRLTETGVDLAPVLIELTLWGARHFRDYAAPPDILELMRTHPDRLISELRSRLLADQIPGVQAKGPSGKAGSLNERSPGSQSEGRRITRRRRRGGITR